MLPRFNSLGLVMVTMQMMRALMAEVSSELILLSSTFYFNAKGAYVAPSQFTT